MSNLYRTTTYSLQSLIEDIRQGRIGLPEIQRPFVWKPIQARDLLDSMYRGYPVGTLLFWDTGAEAGLRQIDNDRESVPRMAIVDGQQRLTSLYAILTRRPVVDKNFQHKEIKIAFSPTLERFEVSNAIIQRDPEYIPDIAEIWGKHRSTVRSFLSRLSISRDEELSEAEQDALEDRIDKVRDLGRFPFQAIEINEYVDPAEVAEIFVRTNSKGVILNQSNFILTLMSVYWDKGRRELEDFCHRAANPAGSVPSPHNHFINPEPSDMLRAVAGLAFRRGRLDNVYNVLRGKDLDTGKFSEERRTAQFRILQEAQDEVLDLTNWRQFLKCLNMAGFRHRRMLTSDIALIYSYVFWLIGKRDTDLDRNSLQVLIARWFFMAHTTRRYTGSPETRVEADLARISKIDNNGEAFKNELNRMIDLELTNDYWQINLPNALDTTAPKSPALSAYWAALVLLDAEALFGRIRVRALLDPVITPPRSLERHHLFPKGYLQKIGVDRKKWNAIANMAFVDWPENASIGSKSPSEYLPGLKEKIGPDRWAQQSYHHALPRGWDQLDYQEFLEKRHKLIAEIVRKGFYRINQDTQDYDKTLVDLIRSGESHTVEFKSTARYNLKAGRHDKKMEHVIVKAVCGFLNSEGGTLLIGVDDEGKVLGLEDDLSTFKNKPNMDKYELWLRNRLEADLSIATAGVIQIEFPSTPDGDVCKVQVSPSGRPVFAKPLEGNLPHMEFWVRIGNATKQLYGVEQHEYIDKHWR
ncbi:MAG: DUF262 domain-containing protein [bacterium]|nr:DUF262 domain-containing protein [bacterium]